MGMIRCYLCLAEMRNVPDFEPFGSGWRCIDHAACIERQTPLAAHVALREVCE